MINPTKMVILKIDDLQTNYKSVKNDVMRTPDYEKQGDEQANAKKYKKAISLYNMARRIYSDLKMDNEVKRLDQKITETDDKRKWYNPFD